MKATETRNTAATLRKASIADALKIQALVKHYADRKEMLHRALNDIYEGIRDYVVLEVDGEMVGCCCLHVCWAELVELRSLAVAPEHTGRGYGSMLVNFVLEDARALDAKTVFALTFQPGYFTKHGFKEVERDSLPKKVWSECIHCVHFPDCGEIAMLHELE